MSRACFFSAIDGDMLSQVSLRYINFINTPLSKLRFQATMAKRRRSYNSRRAGLFALGNKFFVESPGKQGKILVSLPEGSVACEP